MWRMTIYDDFNQNEDSSLMVFNFPQIEENMYRVPQKYENEHYFRDTLHVNS